MSQFLNHLELGPAITSLMKGSELRCAVAFWGAGASHALFPGGLPDDARIVCDLSTGGTNPQELRALGAPSREIIKFLPGLHAKVYLSNEGFIAGSANASDNGIGYLKAAGLVEAGTFHRAGSEAYEAASRWFDEIWVRASVVDEHALCRAQEAWDRRLRKAGTGLDQHNINPASLFDAIAANPGRFRGVGFAFTSTRADIEDRDETAVEINKQDKRLPIPLLTQRERKALAEWPVGHVFAGWPPEDIYAWPQRFVCVHKLARRRPSYYFYERAHTVVLAGGRGMLFARLRGALRRELGFTSSAREMANVDAERADTIFDNIGEDGRRFYENGEKLAQLLVDL